MDQVTVSLPEYKKFWLEFAMRMADYDSSSVLTIDMMTRCLRNWYDIECTIVPGEPVGQVHMTPKMLSVFLLQWA